MRIELLLRSRNFRHQRLTCIPEPLRFAPAETIDLLGPVLLQPQSLGFQLSPVRFPRLGIPGAQSLDLPVSLGGWFSGQASGQVGLRLAEMFFVLAELLGQSGFIGLSLLIHALPQRGQCSVIRLSVSGLGLLKFGGFGYVFLAGKVEGLAYPGKAGSVLFDLIVIVH